MPYKDRRSEKARARDKRYDSSVKGKARRKRYDQSDKGRAKRRRVYYNHTEITVLDIYKFILKRYKDV